MCDHKRVSSMGDPSELATLREIALKKMTEIGLLLFPDLLVKHPLGLAFLPRQSSQWIDVSLR
jgi:hypothetical protein